VAWVWVLAWVRGRDEFCPRLGCRVWGRVNLPAWVREWGEHYLSPVSVPRLLTLCILFQFLVCFLAVPFSFRLLRAVSLQAPKSGFDLYPSVLHYALCLRVVLTRLVLHYSLCLRVALTRLGLHYARFPPVSFLLNLDSTRLPGHRYLPMIVCVKSLTRLGLHYTLFPLFLLCLFC
jgi:hypothetical protein